ncbi:hypothetical protein RDI58_008780 [Solanum bulbocastanum]|uniref:Uncharacterized protein n=1 Tax=Solanum bulbocastanum TaxID=147425 RepID=A0AAN8YK63_SOLBU
MEIISVFQILILLNVTLFILHFQLSNLIYKPQGLTLLLSIQKAMDLTHVLEMAE